MSWIRLLVLYVGLELRGIRPSHQIPGTVPICKETEGCQHVLHLATAHCNLLDSAFWCSKRCRKGTHSPSSRGIINWVFFLFLFLLLYRSNGAYLSHSNRLYNSICCLFNSLQWQCNRRKIVISSNISKLVVSGEKYMLLCLNTGHFSLINIRS